MPARSRRSPTHGTRRIGRASDGIHRVESDQVIDPRQLGYFTDSLTGSDRLHLDTGTPQEAPATPDVEAVQGQSRDGMAHHPSVRFVRRLAELECRPIQRSLAYQKRSSSLNTPRSTSTKVFCVSNSEAATLAPAVTFEPLLTPAEAGVLLRVHAKTAIKMARAKVIQAIRIGKHWRFRASWINEYIAKQLQSSGQPA